MTQFEHAVKKQEEIQQLKKDKKELIEMLKSFTDLFAGNYQERKRQGVNALYNQANNLIQKVTN